MRRFLSLFLILFFIAGCVKRVTIPINLIESVTKNAYPDANGVIVFDSTIVKVESDARAEYTSHSLIKILSTYGKKKFGEQDFFYNAKFDTAIINLARVITPDGKEIKVPGENIKDIPFVPIEAQGSKMFLPDVRVIKVTFPGIEIGSSIEYITTQIIKRPVMKGKFTDICGFEDEEPILDKVYILKCPNTMGIRYKIKNGAILSSEEIKGNNLVYKWEVKDIPGIIKEPAMPFMQDVAREVIISNIQKWKDISKWYYKISEFSYKSDDAIKNKVREITDTLQTKEEKIRVLFNFVSKDIRYLRTEIASKEKGLVPDPASLTYERRWGVCRDKASLLVSMLNEIGVNAYTVLVNVSHKTDKEIPTWIIEHAIVAIPLPDGNYQYMDPTMEYTMDYFPSIEQNRFLLPCTKEGEDLRFVPFIEPERNSILSRNAGTLDKDGNLSAKLTLEGAGFLDTQLRSLRLISPAQRKTMIEQMIHSISPDAVLEDFSISDISDLTTPLRIEISYSVPEYAIKKANELHIIPTSSSASLSISGGGQSPWGLSKRKYPIWFWSPIKTKSVTELTLPKRYRVKKLPELFKREYKRFSAEVTAREKEGKLLLSSEFFIKDPFIPVNDYKNLKAMTDDLTRLGKREIVLIKGR